jgi:tetratricopeptide (TPR) repeat protein
MTLGRPAVPLLAALAALICAAPALPQSSIQGTGPVLVEIRGQVRYSDGQAAGDGIMITVNNLTEGGIAASIQTNQSGRFRLTGIPQAVYQVIAHRPGFRDDSQRVVLTTVPTAYVTLTLSPLPGETSAANLALAPGATVSAAELALPPPTRKEFETGRDLLEKDHNPKKAVGHLRKVVKEAPSFAEGYLLLGTAQMDLERWKDAQEALQHTVALDDKAPGALLALGTCYNEEQKFSEAEKPLVQGLKLDPNSATGQYELARTYWSLNRWQDAAPHAQKAVVLDPSLAPAHVVMGNVMLRERNGLGALKEFQEYLRLDPKGAMAEPVRDIVGKLQKALGTSR